MTGMAEEVPTGPEAPVDGKPKARVADGESGGKAVVTTVGRRGAGRLKVTLFFSFMRGERDVKRDRGERGGREEEDSFPISFPTVLGKPSIELASKFEPEADRSSIRVQSPPNRDPMGGT